MHIQILDDRFFFNFLVKWIFWVGKKKGREEEDDDDDARMLDEFPPHLSPLCKFLVEKGFQKNAER